MKRSSSVCLNILFIFMFFHIPCWAAVPEGTDAGTRPEVLESYGKLPLSFVENRGQRDNKICYYLNIKRGTINFTEEGITYMLLEKIPPSEVEKAPTAKENAPGGGFKAMAFTLKPIGGNKDVEIVPKEKLPGKVNYLLGRDRTKWHTGIPTYREIVYQELYPGIDLKIYGTNNQMEYDFVVSPEADPAAIKMSFQGTEGLRIDEEGNLVIKTPICELTHLNPITYQEIDGKRVPVESGFKVTGKSFAFHVGDYDKNHPLIIDPLTLSYSTYLGGGGTDSGEGIAVDGLGCAYVTGYTHSAVPTPFPLEAAYQGVLKGDVDAFVTKFYPEGNTVAYSTYFGGIYSEYAYGIAVDSLGNAHIVGRTSGQDLPIAPTDPESPYQADYGEGNCDAFVTKFNSEGSGLLYSTYLGGSGDDYGRGIALDCLGNAYVAGYTDSSDFPTANAYQPAYGGGSRDVFVTKIDPDGKGVTYSTYLGGGDRDYGFGVAVDSSGNCYVTGYTKSVSPTGFPLSNPYQDVNKGNMDAFVTKLNPEGSGLVYSTYLGGAENDAGFGVAIDSSGNCYLTGYTYSSIDFPLQNAYQEIFGGGTDNDAFVTKLNAEGNGLVYSTYLGGSDRDYGSAIAVDSLGNAYVAGRTESWEDFPIKKSCQGFGGAEGDTDGFVARFNASGTSTVYSTYLGGSYVEYANGIAVDGFGSAYVAGHSVSWEDFPLENSYQEMFGGGDKDAFVTKLVFVSQAGLALDDGDFGLWHYDGSDWIKLGGADPEWLCGYGDKLLGDYGSLGLWKYDGVSWCKLGGADPDNSGNTMVAYASGVAIDYGVLGLWYYDGSDFTRLGGADPQWLCAYEGNLVGDYGPLGLWKYDGALWRKLGGADPDNGGNTMVAYSGGVAVDYGSLGLWHYDGAGWTKLGGADPEHLCAVSESLFGDYGSLGLWKYDGASWCKLGGADPDNSGSTMVAYASGVAIDYCPLGVWHFDGFDWSQLRDADPEWLCVYGGQLVGDFGGLGLWEFDGNSWIEIGGASPSNPDNTGNTMVEAGWW
jgi:hypothetical protein